MTADPLFNPLAERHQRVSPGPLPNLVGILREREPGHGYRAIGSQGDAFS
jgi:hypothetical protein